MLALLRSKQRAAIDSEFNHDGTVEVFSLCVEVGTRYVVAGVLFRRLYEQVLLPMQDKIRLIYQHFKADYRVFLQAVATALGAKPGSRAWREIKRVILKTFHCDTMVMDFVHDENDPQHGLKYQERKWLGNKRQEYKQLFSYVPEGKKLPIVMQPRQMWRGELPDDALKVRTAAEWRRVFTRYSGDDAEGTLRLYLLHRKYIESIGYWQNFTDPDGDVEWTRTLIAMEDRGVPVNVPYFERIARLVAIRQQRILHRLRSDSGMPKFNPNSNPQKHSLFFKKLKWPVRDDLRTKSGAPSLNAEALAWYVDEKGYGLAALMQAWNREESMRRSVTAILAGVTVLDFKDPQGTWHKVTALFTDFHQVAADTGRISSRKRKEVRLVEKRDRKGNTYTVEKEVKTGLQLQNVPVRKEKDLYGIRGGFIAPPGYDLICADYSGFELMMAIHWASRFAKRSGMLEAIKKYKTPSALHGLTAIASANLKGVTDPLKVKELYPDEYNSGKQSNFNLLYGGQAKMLCRIRGWDWRNPKMLVKAERDIRTWNLTWPEMQEMQQGMINHGYEHGWVPLIDGRRAHVAEGLASDDFKRRSYFERKCMNTPCQGSAAVIAKIAGNLIEKDKELRAWGFRQLLWVHDECVGIAPEATSAQCEKRVCEHMVAAGRHRILHKYPLKFDLHVTSKRAKNWLAAK